MQLLACINRLANRGKYSGEHGQFLRDFSRCVGRVVTVSRLKYRPDVLDFKLDCLRVDEIETGTIDDWFTFEETCEMRAGEILRLKQSLGLSYLNVMWSGGIDSTTALVSLLKYWSPADLESVRVICSDESIIEYPWFYDTYINGKIPVLDTMRTKFDRFFDDSLVLTGECGDQIFGSDIIELVGDYAGGVERLRTSNYKDQLRKFFTSKTNRETAGNILELYLPIVKESPIPIRNAIDFLWWWNFSQKWQYVKYRYLLYGTSEQAPLNASRTAHFFDSPDFQRWSLTNHEKKIPEGWVTYKLPAKDFIIDWTGDEDYRSKLKIQSLQNLSVMHIQSVAMATDYSFVDDLYPYFRKDFSYGFRPRVKTLTGKVRPIEARG